MTREEMFAFCETCPVREKKPTCNRTEECSSCERQEECLPHCISEEMQKKKQVQKAVEEIRARREADEKKY